MRAFVLLCTLPVLLSYHEPATTQAAATALTVALTPDTGTSAYATVGAIPLPAGYQRISIEPTGFGNWLRNIALKKSRTVYLYNGTLKQNQEAQFAVLNISVGHKDLQQCADAVMRLRAEYLYTQHRYADIVFTDDNGKPYRFTTPFTAAHFSHYLEMVFGYCGTSSLSRQLKSKTVFRTVEPGDVLIKGGFPGHAVMVMDVAVNASGHKVYLLAQSYMPAQDIHVLRNPANGNDNPWYDAVEGTIVTPQWVFTSQQLKTW